MVILPAIDVIGGKCVRLTQGDYARSQVYADNPVEVAKSFSGEGATWIHIVDLDGAKAGRPVNLPILESIRDANLACRIEFGGGLRSIEDIGRALAAGADRVVVGSALTVSEPFATACFKLGESVVAGIDTRDGKVAVHGWMDETNLNGVEFGQRMAALGCRRVIWTDIATDGMLEGPNLDGLDEMARRLPIPVIASGGVSCLEDLAAISKVGVEGVIVGRALYDGRFTLSEAIRAIS